MTSVTLQRKGNYQDLIIGYLNINSIRNKFELIAETTKEFDVFLIPESKLDLVSTFSDTTQTDLEEVNFYNSKFYYSLPTLN